MIYRDPPTLDAALSGTYAFGPVHEYTPAGTIMSHYWEEYVRPLEIHLKDDLRAGEYYDVLGRRIPKKGEAKL